MSYSLKQVTNTVIIYMSPQYIVSVFMSMSSNKQPCICVTD